MTGDYNSLPQDVEIAEQLNLKPTQTVGQVVPIGTSYDERRSISMVAAEMNGLDGIYYRGLLTFASCNLEDYILDDLHGLVTAYERFSTAYFGERASWDAKRGVVTIDLVGNGVDETTFSVPDEHVGLLQQISENVNRWERLNRMSKEDLLKAGYVPCHNDRSGIFFMTLPEYVDKLELGETYGDDSTRTEW